MAVTKSIARVVTGRCALQARQANGRVTEADLTITRVTLVARRHKDTKVLSD